MLSLLHYALLTTGHSLPFTLSFPLQGVDTEAGWWSGSNRSIFSTLSGGDYAWLSVVGVSNKWNALFVLSFDGPSLHIHIHITYLSHKYIPLIEARLACNILQYIVICLIKISIKITLKLNHKDIETN